MAVPNCDNSCGVATAKPNYSMTIFRLQLAIGDLKYQWRRKALTAEQKQEIDKYCEKIKKIMEEMQCK